MLALPSAKSAFNTARNLAGVVGLVAIAGALYTGNLGATAAITGTNLGGAGSMAADGLSMIPGVNVG